MWEISHGTTADMEFCPVCGKFGDHYEGDECVYESGYSCGEYEVISEDDLLSIVEKALEEESEDKEIKFMDDSGSWSAWKPFEADNKTEEAKRNGDKEARN